MRHFLFAAMATFALSTNTLAQGSGKTTNDTVSASGRFSHSTTNLSTDSVNPKEGGAVSIDYRWQLSTLLGEPILKCDAAWTLDGVYIKRKPNAQVVYIAAKDLPPKVAASVQLIDLDVLATSNYLKTSFTCDTGVPARQGKERSWNFPTSPDWHEMFFSLHSAAGSKEQAARDNKEKFKALLDKREVASLFQYQVKNIEFDLLGVREWLREQEEKALERTEKQVATAKPSNTTDAKKADLETSRAALATMAEAAAKERDSTTTAQNQKKGTVEGKGKQFDSKMADLKQRNVIAGRWERDDGAIVEIDSIDKWEPGGGRSRIVVAPKIWREVGLTREYKTRNIRLTRSSRYECEDLYIWWKKTPVVNSDVTEQWAQCSIEVMGENSFSITSLNPRGGSDVRRYTRK